MYYLYKFSIDLEESFIVLLSRIFPKFDLKWSRTLYDSFRKSNVQVTKGFLQSNLPSIAKTHKLQFSIRMRSLGRQVLRFYVLVLLCFFPYISCPTHIAINIQSKKILVIMEATHLFHTLHQISYLKGKGVDNIVCKSFIVSFKDGFFLLSHYLYHFSQVFHLLEANLYSHRTVHCQVTQPCACSVLIEFISNLSINSKTEVIHKMFGKNLPLNGLILSILYSLKFSIRQYTNFSLPNIQTLYLRSTPLFNKILQLSKSILCELRLLFSPPQIPREIIASTKRNNGQIDQQWINTFISHFGNYPHNSSISSTNYAYYWPSPRRKSFQMIETLVLVLSHIVEVDTVWRTIQTEIYSVDLCGMSITCNQMSALPTPPPEPLLMKRRIGTGPLF